MFNLKQISLSVAALGTILTVGTSSTPAQALNIVSGSVSGTWQRDYDGAGGLNVGDTFAASYTYDSDSIVEEDNSSDYENQLSRFAPLLSLVLSGSFDHTFDFSDSVGGGNIIWRSFQSSSPEYAQHDFEDISVIAFDHLTSGYENIFHASNTLGIDYSGQPFSNSYASVSSYDYRNLTSILHAESYSNVNLSGSTPAPTSVPTPAMLPGLIGLGVAALRKRKQNQEQEAVETVEV